MSPEERRRRRLKEIASWIEADSPASLQLIVGKGVLRWGAKRETVRQYVEDLAYAGLIEVNEKEDRITWLGSG